MKIFIKRTYLLLVGTLLINLTAYSQPEFIIKLTQKTSGSITNVVSIQREVRVKQTGFGAEDNPESANGSKTHSEKIRRVVWSKKPDGTQVDCTLQRITWTQNEDKPDYDSDNAFERSDIGQSIGENIDPFVKKIAKIRYRPNGAVDTITTQKRFFNVWQGYQALHLSDKHPVWDDILLISAFNRPLTVGGQWSDSSRTDQYVFSDSYTVLQADNQSATIILKRKGKPLLQALPSNGETPKQPGNYLSIIEVSGKLIIDKQTGLIHQMDVREEGKRIDVRKNITVEISYVQTSTVKNKQN